MASPGRKPGSMMMDTVKNQDMIVDLCKSQSMTYDDIKERLGFSYKTAWTYVQQLIKDGRLVELSRRNGKSTFGAIEQRSIPHIPGPSESISPMQIIGKIAHTKGEYTGKLEQATERWNAVISGIMRTAVVIVEEDKFPQDRHADYEKYLRVYREELALRLAQVNALLQNDKFWTREGLENFANDTGWNIDTIKDAYTYSLNKLQPSVGDSK